MIQNLKRYPEYKDSQLPWVGRIPSHWEIERGKWLFRKMDRPTRDADEVVTCFRDGIVTLRKNRRVRGFTESIKEIGYQGIRRGDLVIHAMDAFAGAVGVADSDGKGSPVYSVCQPTARVQSHYYAHLVREMARNNWILALSRGIRERSTDFRFDGFGSQHVPVPPPNEQRAIVRFLNYTDRRIRSYIRAKQKLIKLLEAQKQAIIQWTVTKGIALDVKLKQSDIEWLGDIPEHWGVLRSRYLFREIDFRSETGQETHLSMSQKLGLVPSEMVQQKTLISESYAGGKICEPEDLVLNRLKAHLGVFALANQRGVVSPDYTVFRKRHPLNMKYFVYVLRSPLCRRELRIRAKGIVQGFWRLYTDDFYDIRLPVPPVNEQDEIVDAISLRIRKLETSLAETEREIALLRELRTRLIADVVTGKVDVRTVSEELPEEAEEPEEPVVATETEELADESEEPIDASAEHVTEEAEA